MKITKTSKEKSVISFDVVIEKDDFMSYWDKAVKKVKETVELDGFRKGHVPENIIVSRFGDMIVLEEMVNLALREAYVEAISEHKIIPVGEPQVQVKKLAKDNDCEFTIDVAVLPEVKLPDYKTVAKGVKVKSDEEVKESEVDDVLKELQKGRAHAHHHHDGHDHTHDHDHSHGEHDHPLPPLDDAFAKSFGDTFVTIDDLKNKVRENLGLEKKQKAKESRRQEILESLMGKAEADIPDALLEQELDRMLMQMKGDVTKFGGTWEEYLTHAKKTEEELRSSWKESAHKRVLSQLVLAEIAKLEKLTATEEEIEVELVRLLAQVQDADPTRAKEYLFQALSNEKVLKMLEEEK